LKTQVGNTEELLPD